MDAVGHHIYAGGFTLGVRKHFNVLCHLEAGTYGAATARAGLKIPVHTDEADWPKIKKGLPFLYGNPPCSAWSRSGRGMMNWRTHDAVQFTRRHFQLLEEVRPKVWAWESVPGAWSAGRELVTTFVQEAEAMGYESTVVLVNPMRLRGGYQNRKRFFLVCSKVQIPWDDNERGYLETPVSLGDCLARCRPVKNPTYAKHTETHDPIGLKVLAQTGQGEQMEETRRGMVQRGEIEDGRRYGFLWYRPREERPPRTVMASGMLHPIEDRVLSIEELKHISGFPRNYPLQGSGQQQAGLLSRGVLPVVGAWLSKQVREGLESGSRVGRKKRHQVFHAYEAKPRLERLFV